MNCSVCGDPAAIMVRSEGMRPEVGIMVIVAWSGWDEIAGGTPAAASLFCAPHAGEHLAKLPLLAPVQASAAAGGVYTHG